MISKNSKVFLIKIENESSQVVPKMCVEHFGSTNKSNEIAIPFDDTVRTIFIPHCLEFKEFFSTFILQSTEKRGANSERFIQTTWTIF